MTQATATPPQVHPEFEWIRSTPVESLNCELQEFRHRRTGAPHLHIAADDDQNVFLVALRTVPHDSTGVAHILEHTALCGSRRYPVRDPFFMMIRRSLNTFMNAFTSSDWTAYPFASRNRKDYYNLLDVYLDAVFFPKLDPLDFAQEGHRVEFAKPDDPNSELVFKGVVFNEMKGAMSSPVAALYQRLTTELFPTVTYHYNSGGDPEAIPDLTYEELVEFHRSHYHPSNAIFFTYGDLSAAEQQALFHDKALKEFQKLDSKISVPDEERYGTPVRAHDRYALDGETDTADKTHIVTGWLLDRSDDIEAVMTAHLVSGVLLDNGASPLRRALETTELGDAPSPLCGLQDSNKEMFFACGVEGSEPDRADAVEKLILDTLHEVADKGVDAQMVEAVLHQLELSQREISGDGFPYGLQLIMHAISPFVHGGDPVAALNIDPVLTKLRERIQDPEFIKGEVRKLIQNEHRVTLVMEPDPNLGALRQEREKARLAALRAALDENGRRHIVEQAKALEQRQEHEDDPEVLPKVGLEDIPADLAIPEGESLDAKAAKATWFTQPTNGLVYQEVVTDMPALAPEQEALVPLLCGVLDEVGSGGRDYLETQALQAAVTGAIGARATVRAGVEDVGDSRGVFVVGGKALARNQGEMTKLIRETFETARFDELPRIRELVAQERLRREQAVTGSGHALAMTAASAAMSPAAALSHRWSGLAGIRDLKGLDDSLESPDRLRQFAGELEGLREQLIAGPRQFLLIGEDEQREPMARSLDEVWGGAPAPGAAVYVPAAPEGRVNQAWITSTAVNFCARAYQAVPSDHPDAAPFMVLGGFLRNNFLHRAIREQGGAYGGGAGFDGDAGAFRFFSYRDPRLTETLADFDRAIDWLVAGDHPWRLVEEAILGVIGAIDKPASPAGEARKAFHMTLHGRTPEQRRRLRQRVLEVRQEDLKRIAETYLLPERAHTAVITSASRLEQDDPGLEVCRL